MQPLFTQQAVCTNVRLFTTGHPRTPEVVCLLDIPQTRCVESLVHCRLITYSVLHCSSVFRGQSRSFQRPLDEVLEATECRLPLDSGTSFCLTNSARDKARRRPNEGACNLTAGNSTQHFEQTANYCISKCVQHGLMCGRTTEEACGVCRRQFPPHSYHEVYYSVYQISLSFLIRAWMQERVFSTSEY